MMFHPLRDRVVVIHTDRLYDTDKGNPTKLKGLLADGLREATPLCSILRSTIE